METENQPGALGFAYVEMFEGAINEGNSIYRGALTSVVLHGPGEFDFVVEGLDWPWSLVITPLNVTLASGHGVLAIPYWSGGSPGDSPSVKFYDSSFSLANPDIGFLVSILPT